MKIITVKILVLLLCVPAYPFIAVGSHYERNSYFGKRTTFSEISKEYWCDVWDAITYKKGR
jgi:hypothetical protein